MAAVAAAACAASGGVALRHLAAYEQKYHPYVRQNYTNGPICQRNGEAGDK